MQESWICFAMPPSKQEFRRPQKVKVKCRFNGIVMLVCINTEFYWPIKIFIYEARAIMYKYFVICFRILVVLIRNCHWRKMLCNVNAGWKIPHPVYFCSYKMKRDCICGCFYYTNYFLLTFMWKYKLKYD